MERWREQRWVMPGCVGGTVVLSRGGFALLGVPQELQSWGLPALWATAPAQAVRMLGSQTRR